MKIDLHCHTKKTKTGDGRQRNVTPELFKEKISLADIKIVAITNHNAFDYEQFVLLQEVVSLDCVKYGLVLKLMFMVKANFI